MNFKFEIEIVDVDGVRCDAIRDTEATSPV